MHAARLEAVQAAPCFPSALLDRVQLADGRHVHVRPVLPDDEDAEQGFVRALSASSRLRRFHIGIRELAPQALYTMTHLDYCRHVAVVAESVDADGEATIVADARYVMLDDDSGAAEFAVAVADAWQGAGLGRALMERLIHHAGSHGVTRLVGDVLHDNAGMIGLARRLGARVARHPGDARLAQARFDL